MKTGSIDKEVLFQKIGHIWYAFAEVENDIIYTALPNGVDPRETSMELYEVIEEHMEKVSSLQRSTFNESAL